MKGSKVIPAGIFALLIAIPVTHSIPCYSCQYSDNPNLIGYECVTSPADYNLGPPTTECGDAGCQTEVQSINDFNSVWYIQRGCKSKEDGCTGMGFSICVETCTDSPLCNSRSHAPSVGPPGSTLSTVPTTTTTEIPGTRWCHSCVYSYHPDVPDTCVTDPANVPPPNMVRCPPNRVCTIFHQWDKGNQVVRSITRGCEEQYRNNGCVEDTFFITCYTFCTGEFCNSGDGSRPPLLK